MNNDNKNVDKVNDKDKPFSYIYIPSVFLLGIALWLISFKVPDYYQQFLYLGDILLGIAVMLFILKEIFMDKLFPMIKKILKRTAIISNQKKEIDVLLEEMRKTLNKTEEEKENLNIMVNNMASLLEKQEKMIQEIKELKNKK